MDPAKATGAGDAKYGMIAGVLGGAILSGMMIFTFVRMLSLNNGQSSTTEIDSSTKVNAGVLFTLTILLGICYALLVLKGELNPTQKYTIVFALSVLAFFLSNLAILTSTIYVQVN